MKFTYFVTAFTAISLFTACNSNDSTLQSASNFKLEGCKGGKPWMFFDLGAYSMVTTPKDSTGDINNFTWIRYKSNGKQSDSYQYLLNLRKNGFPVGMIINIPAEWGDKDLSAAKAIFTETDPLIIQEKSLALTEIKRNVIASFFDGINPDTGIQGPKRWIDTKYKNPNWSFFALNKFLVPFLNEYRKPKSEPFTADNLYLFNKAINLAAADGCPVIYQSAIPIEIIAANQIISANGKVRMRGRNIGPYDTTKITQNENYYLPENKIIQFALTGQE